MNRVLLTIIKKEFWHIGRDRQTLLIILLWPALMIILFGYAITMEMQQIETIIVDQSETPQSRQFIDQITATDFFKLTGADIPESAFEQAFFERQARCILVIPPDFSNNLQADFQTKIQLLIDASDPNAANYINNYLNNINARFTREINKGLVMPFSVEARMFYNPSLRSDYFFVPGLIAIILLLISALLTSIAIVREKEVGTLEQVMVSPVKPIQILIGKVVPYTVIGFIDGVLILIIGHFWFGVPMIGSTLLLSGTLIVYIITGLSFGLLISTVTTSQQVAMMAALLATIIPTIMLSGFIFPVSSMPRIFYYLSLVIPATHFLDIIRGIMLKGNGIQELAVQIVYLLLLSSLMIMISVRKFKTKLE